MGTTYVSITWIEAATARVNTLFVASSAWTAWTDVIAAFSSAWYGHSTTAKSVKNEKIPQNFNKNIRMYAKSFDFCLQKKKKKQI